MDNVTLCESGLKFNTNTPLELYRVKKLFEKEPETIAWIDSWTEAQKSIDSVFFDIGANIGIFSLYAAHKSKYTKVFSFEPVSDNYVALIANIKINAMDNVRAFNAALSNKNKLSDLYINDLRVGNSGAQIDEAVNEKQEFFQPSRVESVLCFSLDNLISGFQVPFPNFIKIDVDGHETDILSGMIKTLSDKRLISILVEFNNNQELNVWKERLQELGLKLDDRFDNVDGHSRFRRMKNNSTAINSIFSRYKTA